MDLTTTIMIVALLGGGILTGILLNRALGLAHSRRIYEAGVLHGRKEGAEEAVQAERLAVQRRLHDSGRRAMAREGADPVRIHKLQLGPRRPGRPAQ